MVQRVLGACPGLHGRAADTGARWETAWRCPAVRRMAARTFFMAVPAKAVIESGYGVANIQPRVGGVRKVKQQKGLL